MDKQKKDKAVELLVEYRDELQAELDSIDKTIKAITGEPVVPRQENLHLHGSTYGNSSDHIDWEGLTFQESVLECLAINQNKPIRASEIARFLRNKGVRGSNKKSFSPMCASTVRRLVDKGKAIRTDIEVGNREVAAFQIKKQDFFNDNG